MVNLLYDKKSDRHYYCGDPACFECREQIIEKGYHVALTCLKTERIGHRQYRNTLLLKERVYCETCAFIKKKLRDVVYWTEIRLVLMITPPPLGSIPVILKPNYDVKDSKSLQAVLTTWAAESDKGIKSDTSACQINDQTKHANKESWEGACIGAPVKDDGKDRLLTSDEADKVLDEIFNSAIVCDEKKQIGEDKNA